MFSFFLPIVIYPSFSPTSNSSSGPRGGVPGTLLPSLVYRPLWQGQKNISGLLSSTAHVTVQPKCFHTGVKPSSLFISLSSTYYFDSIFSYSSIYYLDD